MAKTFAEWAATEVHDPKDKISNLEKLTADFLIGDYKTWGEVYEAAGIKPPKPKAKAKKKDSLRDLNFKINMARTRIEQNENALFRYEKGTPDYEETAAAVKRDKTELKGLQSRLDTIKETEAVKKEEKTYEKEKSSYETDFADAQEALQIAKDTGGNVAAAEAELERVTASRPFAPSGGTAGFSGQQAGYLNRASQTVGTTPTPATPTTPKGETPPKGGTGSGKDDGKKKDKLTPAEKEAEALAAAAANKDFSLPETLFNNVDELTELLDDYVKSDKNGGQWTLDTFRQKFRNTNWYKNNSVEIKNRYVQLYNYNDQKKGGQDVSNTDYAKQISTLERQIADKARRIGSGIASDPDALRRAAENFYITNVGIDDAMATDLIAAAIRPIVSTIGGQPTEGYSGQALRDYQAIQDIARSNGFRVKDIIPGGSNERQVLEGIATGRLDANRIAQDARRLAMQGQPEYVRDLLSQGYNLDQVFAPYRQTMANLLEINADEIDLNDSTLQSAISDKGDMNLYDFKKTLKADKRWQYTENAKSEVSDMTLKILRDFGFQG
jgi:hypothetical protein